MGAKKAAPQPAKPAKEAKGRAAKAKSIPQIAPLLDAENAALSASGCRWNVFFDVFLSNLLFII